MLHEYYMIEQSKGEINNTIFNTNSWNLVTVAEYPGDNNMTF